MLDLRVFVYFGESDSRYSKIEYSCISNPLNYVDTLKHKYSNFYWCLIVVPELDIIFVRDFSRFNSRKFNKFRGIKILFVDYPFLKELDYEK